MRPPELLKQNTNQKTALIQKKTFIANFVPVKRFNFAHFNFPGKFLLSYNTAMIYTQSSLKTHKKRQNTN